MISTDRKIFDEKSAVRQRMVDYGTLVDELHIVVFSTKKHGFLPNSRDQIASNIWAYPTASATRFAYMKDAKKIGLNIVRGTDWIVTTQDPFETGVVGKYIKDNLNIPLQLQIHTDFQNPYFRHESFLNKIRMVLSGGVLGAADCIRVVSKRIKDSIKEGSEVLPIFVDIEKIKNTKLAFDLHDRFKSFKEIILIVSRLESEKNVELGISAFKEVMKKYPDTGLVIVGDGSERAKLEFMGVRNVVFEGWKNDLVSYYKGADIYLNTSNYEGYGMSLIEAASSGTSVVTTDVGIVGDVLVDGESALVSRVGDIEGISKNLMRLVEDRDLRERIASSALRSVESHIGSNEEYLSRYKELWQNCGK